MPMGGANVVQLWRLLMLLLPKRALSIARMARLLLMYRRIGWWVWSSVARYRRQQMHVVLQRTWLML